MYRFVASGRDRKGEGTKGRGGTKDLGSKKRECQREKDKFMKEEGRRPPRDH